MKNFIKLFGIVALVAVIGFSVTSCGGDDNGGGDDLSLYISSVYNSTTYEVQFKITSTALKDITYSDYTLTINGTSATIINGGHGSLNGTMHKTLYFTISPDLTVGTKYAVVVKYTGSAVAPFTVEGTVPLQE